MFRGKSGRIDVGIAVTIGAGLAIFALGHLDYIIHRQESRFEQVIAYTAGLCATGGPTGAAFLCGNWGMVRHVGSMFYRCGLHTADGQRLIRHLRVAQFSSEEAAERGEQPTNTAICDEEGRILSGDGQRWIILPLTVVK